MYQAFLPPLLKRLGTRLARWLHGPAHPDNVMLWAAAYAGFFGFLWAGEFIVPSIQGYDPEVHLNFSDLALDSHTALSLFHIRINSPKQTRSDRGWTYFWGQYEHMSSSGMCKVPGIAGHSAGPPLRFPVGSPSNPNCPGNPSPSGTPASGILSS